MKKMTLSPKRKEEVVLISVKKNTHVDYWEKISNSNSPDSWSIKKSRLYGGKQAGVDIITVDNGKVSFIVIPTRGMSVYKANMGDVQLGWDSPVKEIVHPMFVDQSSRLNLGWLDGFNEWMPRSGIAWAGHAGEDNGDMLTLHGGIGNTPASEVSVVIAYGKETEIIVKGTVHEKSVFGSNLTIETQVCTTVGSNHITFNDEIINNSCVPQEYQIIYHSNYGEPLLGAGSKFVAPIKKIWPFDNVAAKALDTYETYLDADPDFKEQVFGMQMYHKNKETKVLLHNNSANKGVLISYRTDELPYFTLWKNTGAKGEAYVTGLEPSTSFPSNRSIERKAGRVPILQPGASQAFYLDFTILDSVNGVSFAINLIERIRADQALTMDKNIINFR